MNDKNIVKIAVYILVGAVLGYGYYRLVGCKTGACPITSNPFISVIYGAVLGALAGGVI